MNDTYLTISGNVVDDPKLRRTATNGVPVLTFRVASTSRRRDADTGDWSDRDNLFVNVTCWRSLATNVSDSLFKGQPVVIHGRFYSRQYTKDEMTRTTYEIDAISIGHDLSRGVSTFKKSQREVIVTSVEVDADGLPADVSDAIYAAAEELDARSLTAVG
jgi:single-strand DNA-binding protein